MREGGGLQSTRVTGIKDSRPENSIRLAGFLEPNDCWFEIRTRVSVRDAFLVIVGARPARRRRAGSGRLLRQKKNSSTI